MHGTGTPLGDPVEVAAALTALRTDSLHQGKEPVQRLALMASKSQAGHCEPAAGLVGSTGAMAALSTAALAPVLHLRSLNPHVEAAGNHSVAVARMHGGWASLRRRSPACSVSSFAFQVAPTLYVHFWLLSVSALPPNCHGRHCSVVLQPALATGRFP